MNREILQSKAAYRRQLARRPVAEKLRILEELAERAWVIRNRKQAKSPIAAVAHASRDPNYWKSRVE